MKLTNHKSIKFDRFLPMYNWIYPLSGKESNRFTNAAAANVFAELHPAKSRAIYVHIPFCETICSFCPFVRDGLRDNLYIDEYVQALLKEMELKAKFDTLTSVPIGSIFFGGGTPSLLEPKHIRLIGQKLHQYFDLSQLQEFSFEFEVKSVTPDRIEALREIGVTHARFGLQTFSPKYRDIFELTSSIEQVHLAKDLLATSFPYVSCDMIYAINGQTEIDLFNDITAVSELKLNNIDFYPINNLATQTKLHRKFRKMSMPPTSGLTKHFMNLFIREAMRENGYLPHNGHGYVKVDAEELENNPVVTNQYSFAYHEHVYSYPNYDLLGFGTNAVSSFSGFSVFNPSSRNEYMASLKKGELVQKVGEHDLSLDACRPLALALPYHGRIEKNWVSWNKMPEDINLKYNQLVEARLIEENADYISLTRDGWNWYTNVMYYLLPNLEQKTVTSLIHQGYNNSARDIEPSGLEDFNFSGGWSDA